MNVAAVTGDEGFTHTPALKPPVKLAKLAADGSCKKLFAPLKLSAEPNGVLAGLLVEPVVATVAANP